MKIVTLNNPVEVIANIPNKVVEIGSKVSDLKDGTVEAIEIIGKLSKMIINAIDYIGTVILNPEIMLTFIDEMTIVIVISLIVLKMIGFKKMEKWMMLFILIKVVASVL